MYIFLYNISSEGYWYLGCVKGICGDGDVITLTWAQIQYKDDIVPA